MKPLPVLVAATALALAACSLPAGFRAPSSTASSCQGTCEDKRDAASRAPVAVTLGAETQDAAEAQAAGERDRGGKIAETPKSDSPGYEQTGRGGILGIFWW